MCMIHTELIKVTLRFPTVFNLSDSQTNVVLKVKHVLVAVCVWLSETHPGCRPRVSLVLPIDVDWETAPGSLKAATHSRL